MLIFIFLFHFVPFSLCYFVTFFLPLHPQNYKKMVETLLFSVLIIAIAMVLLLVKVILKKDGRFSSQHIHDSEAMKEKGIHCVIEQDREARQKGKAY